MVEFNLESDLLKVIDSLLRYGHSGPAHGLVSCLSFPCLWNWSLWEGPMYGLWSQLLTWFDWVSNSIVWPRYCSSLAGRVEENKAEKWQVSIHRANHRTLRSEVAAFWPSNHLTCWSGPSRWCSPTGVTCPSNLHKVLASLCQSRVYQIISGYK